MRGGKHLSHFNHRQLVSQEVFGKMLHANVTQCQHHPNRDDGDCGEYLSHYDVALKADDNLLVVKMHVGSDVERLQHIDGKNVFRDFLDGLTLTEL